MFRSDDKLTEHFTLGEFMNSSVAKDKGINLLRELTKEHHFNLQRVADKCEEARSIVGAIRINSGYRPQMINEIVGGSKTSAHLYGLAADLFPTKIKEIHDLQNCFVELANDPKFMLDIDQMIIERGCIHIGLCGLEKTPRRELRGEVYENSKRHYPLIKIWGV